MSDFVSGIIMYKETLMEVMNSNRILDMLSSSGIVIGVKVDEVRIIPDVERKIIDCIREMRKKFNYIFTTGGIGPTHDDITAKSVSKAFNLKYQIHKEAFKILKNYYDP